MQRETLVLQDLTFQDCQETEEHLDSQVLQVQSEPQDLPEGLDEMECQDYQVKSFTLICQLQLSCCIWGCNLVVRSPDDSWVLLALALQVVIGPVRTTSFAFFGVWDGNFNFEINFCKI